MSDPIAVCSMCKCPLELRGPGYVDAKLPMNVAGTVYVHPERAGCPRSGYIVGSNAIERQPSVDVPTGDAPDCGCEHLLGQVGLDEEIKTFQREFATLMKEHAGEFVLIKGSEVVGTYKTYDEAIREGYERFALQAFLVGPLSEEREGVLPRPGAVLPRFSVVGETPGTPQLPGTLVGCPPKVRLEYGDVVSFLGSVFGGLCLIADEDVVRAAVSSVAGSDEMWRALRVLVSDAPARAQQVIDGLRAGPCSVPDGPPDNSGEGTLAEVWKWPYPDSPSPEKK